MARSCYILADYEAVNAYHLRDVSRARTQRLGERGGWDTTVAHQRLARLYDCLMVTQITLSLQSVPLPLGMIPDCRRVPPIVGVCRAAALNG